MKCPAPKKPETISASVAPNQSPASAFPLPPSQTLAPATAPVINESPDAIITETLDWMITNWNASAETLFGYSAEEVIGMPITVLIPSDRSDEAASIMDKICDGESVTDFDTVRLRKGGTPLHVSVSVSPMFDSAGKVIGASECVRDSVSQAETQVAAAIELVRSDSQSARHKNEFVTAQATKLLRESIQSLIDSYQEIKVWIDQNAKHAKANAERLELATQSLQASLTHRGLNKLALEAAQTQIEASRVINDANVNIIAQNKLSMSESLSELSRVSLAFETASANALTDSLTKLPNRRLFNDRLHQAILASARSKTYTAVVFIDLDDFKPINDQYGHAVGDLLLIKIADRIKKAVRDTDTVARFGGDEFVVVLCDLNADRKNAVAEVASIGEKIGRSIAMPITVKNGEESVLVIPQCTASIGGALSLYSRGASEIVFDSLLALADAAMYQAKQAGGDRLCIDESLAGLTRAPWASRSSNGAGRKNR